MDAGGETYGIERPPDWIQRAAAIPGGGNDAEGPTVLSSVGLLLLEFRVDHVVVAGARLFARRLLARGSRLRARRFGL